MKKILAILSLYLGLATCVAPVYAAELATKTAASVAILQRDRIGGCTTWKLGPRQWVTARHCVISLDHAYSITAGLNTLYVRSILVSGEKAKGKDHIEDWAILNVNQDSPDVPILEVACAHAPEIGEAVAYAGYPALGKDQELIFAIGYITGISSLRDHPWTFSANFAVGGGASGSPVVNNETGKVIGIVTKALYLQDGNTLAGIEAAKGFDRCEDLADAAS